MMSIQLGLSNIIPVNLYHARVLSALHQVCFSSGWAEKDITGLLKTPGAAALAALSGTETFYDPGSTNVPVGFILYRCAADECEIITLCVRPENRRQGIARRLLSVLEGILVGCGVVNVFLEVKENNISALKLYEGAGYVHTGRRKDYYQNEAGRRDALLYRRPLLVMG